MQVAIVADVGDEALLGLDPVEVFFFAHQDVLEQFPAAGVTLFEAQTDTDAVSLDGTFFELAVE